MTLYPCFRRPDIGCPFLNNVDACRPKAWWLAQNKFYGLAHAKNTPISILRFKLKAALRVPEGLKIPERILNLEADGNRKYWELQEAQINKKNIGKAPNAIAASSSKPARKGTKPPVGSISTKKASVAGGSLTKSSKPSTKSTTRGKPGVRKPSGTQAAAMNSGTEATRKRKRSLGDSGEKISSKRVKRAFEDTKYHFLTGTYSISAPHIREEWSFIRNKFTLVIQLTSEKRLFGAFHLGIASGVLQSAVNIQLQEDGASAKFQWCGQQENGEYELYAPERGMKGVLRFSRHDQDGRHTIEGVIEDFPTVGKLEFTGVKVKDTTTIKQKWEDFN